MEASGLFVRERSGALVDRFSGRLMFPIHNSAGEIIAFGARRLGDEPGRKYLNSPANRDLPKISGTVQPPSCLRRRSGERSACAGRGVHGRNRCVWSRVRNVVAACGTALSEEQSRQLQRCAPEVVLNFDPDEAGCDAALKHSRTLLQQGLRVRAVNLPGDPLSTFSRTAARRLAASRFKALGR
jgi:DNA primase